MVFLPPDPPAHVFLVQHEESCSSFIKLYEQASKEIARFEDPVSLENLSEDSLHRLAGLLAYFARLGSLYASSEEQALLTQEIVALLAEESPYRDLPMRQEYPLAAWERSGALSYDVEGLLTKSIFKRIRHAASKVARFARHNKKILVIGVLAAAGVGIAAYALMDKTDPAIEPPVEGGGNDDLPCEELAAPVLEEKIIPPPLALESPAPGAAPLLFSPLIVEIEEIPSFEPFEDFHQAPEIDPSSKNPVIKAIQVVTSNLAHDIWHEVDRAGSLYHNSTEQLGELAENLFPDSALIAEMVHPTNTYFGTKTWEQTVEAGHQRIDALLSMPHNPFANYDRSSRFVCGELPPPTGFLGNVQEVSKLSSAIRSATTSEGIALAEREIALSEMVQAEKRIARAAENALTSEELLLAERQALEVSKLNPTSSISTLERMIQSGEVGLPSIKIKDGIWEIAGKNITKFNCRDVIKSSDKMDHLFKEIHQFERLSISQQDILEHVVKKVIAADTLGAIPLNKPFSVNVRVGEHSIEFRGIVIEGELRIGTFFIPQVK